MRKRVTMTVLAGVLLAVGMTAQQKSRQEIDLQAAIRTETVSGDLKLAIKQYEAIVVKYRKTDRALAAMALVHMAECYQKMGDAESRKIYEQVVKDYADQKEAAAEARARLGVGTAGRTGAEPVAQRVWAAEEAGSGFFDALNAQISPDGRRVVFGDWKNGNVAVRDLQTDEIRFLSHGADEGHAQDLLFSPDGKQVAYRRAGKLEAEPIRVVGVDGAHMRDVKVLEYGTFLFAWSPDGKQLAAIQYSSADKTAALVLLNVADGSITRLKSTGWQPAPKIGGFSPDGKFLVYSLAKGASRAQNGVFILAVDGSREAKLIEGAAGIDDPRWTPDGRGIVFLSDRSGTNDLWLVRVADGKPVGEPELVKAQAGAIQLKSFTRDGSLYYGTNQLESDLYQIEIDTEGHTAGAPVRIVDRLVGTNYEPAPSPDGKLLAFFRGTPGASDLRPAALVVRSNATGEENTLLRGISADSATRNLRWYPDSLSLLLEEHAFVGKTEFRRVDAQTGEARNVFSAGDAGVWSHAELARDGRRLFYSSAMRSNSLGPGTVRLIRRDLETGQEKELYRMETRQAGFYGMSLSPDGRSLAFMADLNQNRVLMTMPEAGGETKEIYRAPDSGNQEGLHWYGACWTANGRYILATRSAMSGKQEDELVAFPVEGGEPRVLALMPQITNPSASPDGRHILFTGARRRRELWVMRNFLPRLQASR